MRLAVKLLILFAWLVVFSLAFPVRATWADECDEAAQQGESAGSFRKVERDGETIYEFTGVIRVCGKVPKPNVVVILLEKTVDYEWERLKQDFLPRIRETVRRAPF